MSSDPERAAAPLDELSSGTMGESAQEPSYELGGDEEEYEEYDEADLNMDPDSELMARPQRALKEQLESQKTRIEETLRERSENLKHTMLEREQLGQDLYAMQQQLAKLQLHMEKTHDNFSEINKMRLQSEKHLGNVKGSVKEYEELVDAEKKKSDTIQREYEKLSGTVRQIEQYNSEMKDEIAVTRRATYVAEEAITRMEREKGEQDTIIDTLNEELQGLKKTYDLYEAQLSSQTEETESARSTLAEAEKRMQDINFQKKQLVQQWKSTLIGMARRDEALQATEDALRKQREQSIVIDQEVEGYRRSIRDEQAKNEKQTFVLKTIEGDSDVVLKQIEGHRERAQELEETYAKLKRSLDHTEERRQRASGEGKELAAELQALEKDIIKTNRAIQQTHDEVILRMSEQTTVEKSAQKTAQSVQKIRSQVATQELSVVQIQNELAKVQVDILNTEAHNSKLKDSNVSLNKELNAKGATIEKYEVEIRRRNDEIEKKTKEVDRLNRQYDKLTTNVEDENLGPLESTIVNLSREINSKGTESKDMQRQWVVIQMELVSLQNENNALSEMIQRLKSEQTILVEKRNRLEYKYEQQQKDLSALNKALTRMHTEMTRLNQLISKNSELQAQLANENFNLESGIGNSLKELETEALQVEARIVELTDEKKQVLAEIIEAERQNQLWERKIQLERETQEALDPNVGTDVVGAMKKEIHRMQLRHKELIRKQEMLISEMERAIAKRDMIAKKGVAQQAKQQPEMTESQLVKACKELQKSINETIKESRRAAARIEELETQRKDITEQISSIGTQISSIREQEEIVKSRMITLQRERSRIVIEKSNIQHMTRRLEDVSAGNKAPARSTVEVMSDDLGNAREKVKLVADFLHQLFKEYPQLEAEAERASALQSLVK